MWEFRGPSHLHEVVDYGYMQWRCMNCLASTIGRGCVCHRRAFAEEGMIGARAVREVERTQLVLQNAEPTGSRIIAVNPTLPTGIFIDGGECITLSYRLWARRREEKWCEFGIDGIEKPGVHHWMLIPPLPSHSEFAYSFAVGGCANRFWSVTVGVRQRVSNDLEGWSIRGLWTETGVFDDHGYGGELCDIEHARKVVLFV